LSGSASIQTDSSTTFRPAVVAPTYNNARTLLGILARVEALGLPMIIVNDGSTDDTPRLLAEWERGNRSVPVTVLTHPHNRGKAAALHTAFDAANKMGITHVATVDTDGQLDPEQIPQLLVAARMSPDALVLGGRDDTASDYPAKSRIGRRISNLAIRVESGYRVRDSQCGLRVYPLHLLRAARCYAPHFAFEAEIITRTRWVGFPVVEVPVNCRYLPPGERVSHFKPWRDTFRGLRMHAWLLLLAPIKRMRMKRTLNAEW
jgi:glycosyltransferase involved in cell wall biosynthesis